MTEDYWDGWSAGMRWFGQALETAWRVGTDLPSRTDWEEMLLEFHGEPVSASTREAETGFRKVTDELTDGCGCACHTGVGYNTVCDHCHAAAPSEARPQPEGVEETAVCASCGGTGRAVVLETPPRYPSIKVPCGVCNGLGRVPESDSGEEPLCEEPGCGRPAWTHNCPHVPRGEECPIGHHPFRAPATAAEGAEEWAKRLAGFIVDPPAAFMDATEAQTLSAAVARAERVEEERDRLRALIERARRLIPDAIVENKASAWHNDVADALRESESVSGASEPVEKEGE